MLIRSRFFLPLLQTLVSALVALLASSAKSDQLALQSIRIHPFSQGADPRDAAILPRDVTRAINLSAEGPKALLKSIGQGVPKATPLTWRNMRDSRVGRISQLALHGIAFCDSYQNEGQLPNGQTFAFGRYPDLSKVELKANEEIPPPPSDQELIRLYRAAKGGLLGGAAVVAGRDPCWILNGSVIDLAWDVILRFDGWAYTMRWHQGVLKRISPLFFHGSPQTQGLMKAFRQNPLDGELIDFSISLLNPSSLESEYFVTYPAVDGPKATSDDGTFLYEPSDPEFAEVSTFAHAHSMLSFFQEYGYEWGGPKPLVIETGRTIGGTLNNAVYQPGEAFDDGQPRIRIGRGDGILLQNLELDADVVSHEFGHHVVFTNLKSTRGESLVLHEGLADFFAFARTQDTCLGESICPAGSGACWVESQCLRKAIEDPAELNYGDATYNSLSQAHLQSQVVSGMLWQIREEIGDVAMIKLTLSAIGELLPDSGFRDFLLALFLADASLHEGVHACVMHSIMLQRGFAAQLSDIDCNLVQASSSHIPQLTGGQNAPQPSHSSSGGKGYNPLQCGVVGGSLSAGQDTWYSWLLLILPIGLILGYALGFRRD
jgi:hypothetical protein